MAEGTLIETPEYIGRLTAELSSLFEDAEVGHERIRETRYRFLVISRRFDEMGHPERQRVVWDAAERVLDRNELRDVAMIITRSPTERG